jgi:hypothetical protein
MAYVLDVFSKLPIQISSQAEDADPTPVADTSSLKNRALVFSFATTPYIVTTFIGPRAAQSFLETSGWRFGFVSAIDSQASLPSSETILLHPMCSRSFQQETLLFDITLGHLK